MTRAVVAAALLALGTAAWAAEKLPFYPSALDTATGVPATPGQYTPAQECAYCHPLQHEQWRGTMHASAFVDPLFQATWKEASRETGGKLERFCAGCHTPVGTVTEQVWIRDSGEIVIHPRALEGVTCDFCHTVREVRLLEKGGNPGNAGLVVDPAGPKRGPYADAESTFHETAYSDIHTRSEFCAACHNVLHPFSNTIVARTYEEWKQSIYAEKEIHCQDCHMVPPEVAAQAADTLEKPVRKGLSSAFETIRSPFFDHTFTGANAAMPALLEHWQISEDARLRLLIAARVTVTAPGGAKVGTTLALEVKVENLRAGHNLPTSMSELREMWLHVVVRDEGAGGKVVWETGALDARQRLDASAVRYGVRALDADGKVTWKPWRIEKIERDTSIPPRKAVVEKLSVAVPADAVGPLKVTARLRYRSFPQDVAEQYLGRPGYTVPVINMAAGEAAVKVSGP